LKRVVVIATALALFGFMPARAIEPQIIRDGDVYGSVNPSGIVLGNDLIERSWRPDVLVTTGIRDKRSGGLSATTPQADFALTLDRVRLGSDRFKIKEVHLSRLARGGVRVDFTLTLAGVMVATRTVDAFPGVAGFASQTTVRPLVPLVVSGYTLDEVAAGSGVAPTVQAFRAGSDWREPGWKPQISIGDAHTGDWRATASAGRGRPLTAPGEWMTLANPTGRSVFMVMERMDFSSSRMSYDGTVGSALVDLSRDVEYIGPFEEQAHVENPGPGPARHRVLLPTQATPLERVFTGFGASPDDEPWQFYKYLTQHRLTPYTKAITFNTDGVDDNKISTGAKDDANYARFLTLAAAARQMGVETFIFDDGWQAASGDWCPDSTTCPEPRAPKFPPRFPDDRFAAVRNVLGQDMQLGLWMNPMEFNPAAKAFKKNPQWACAPTGLATAVLNAAQPGSGSNEAGIGVWNPAALGRDPDDGKLETLITYIEGRIRRAIDVYGARYFKFDFLVWSDCVGVSPVDIYAYHDTFVAMLDRLQQAHPNVTFQIDDTNDYRLFPFETIARGPAWFQNGAPDSTQLLHNLWSLSPYVPGFAIGQKSLTNGADVAARGIDYLMSVALPSHITFMTDIDTVFTDAQRAEVRKWTDFYKANRDEIASFTYPLLADPLTKGWTALEPWNSDTQRGFVLAWRQDAPNATQTISLRGLPSSGTFALTMVDPATGSETSLGTADAVTLRSGIAVTIPNPYGYSIIRVTLMG